MRSVLVTGAGSGLGVGIASALADAGWRVAGTVRDGTEPPDERILAVTCDLRDRCALAEAVERTAQAFGRLDALVCNAGVQGVAPLESMTDADWDDTLAVNLTAPVLLARAALPHFRKVGSGAVVMIGSVHGRATAPARIAYAASKAGLEGLARAMAVDLVADRVRVNVVCPGPFDSPAMRAAAKRFFPALNEAEALAAFARSQPMGMIGEAEELGRLVAFVLDERASFISGSVLTIDGGQTARLCVPAPPTK